MPKWEYKITKGPGWKTRADTEDNIEAWFNELGLEGWECIWIGVFFYFKRPLPTATEEKVQDLIPKWDGYARELGAVPA